MEPYNPIELEERIRHFWGENKIVEGLSSKNSGRKKFFLLDGPPYINAEPHVGHVKTTTVKDVLTRYYFMKGFDALIQPGFDCHGLPVEVIVEKELGIKSKREIDALGVDKFTEACFQKVLNNEKLWIDYYKFLGAWRAYFEPYFTYKRAYIESAWHTLKKIHEKGMLVEGDYPIHWCPHCETALSGYEVSDSYKEISDPSIFIKFKVKGSEDEFLLVWTTTPWTLPANVAVVVHPEEYYIKARVGRETYIIAEKRADAVLKQTLGFSDYHIIERLTGSDLDGLEYEPIFQFGKNPGKGAYRVYLSIRIMKHKKYKKHRSKEETKSETAEEEDEKEEFEDFVTMNEGTGLVHCAPGHGSTDYFVGEYYNIPKLSPVDEQGRFTEEVPVWQGLFVKKADSLIIEELRNKGNLLHSSEVIHSYPLCWRCKSPLIFRLSKQWYLKVQPIKEKMIRANEEVNWMPAYGKESFRNWLSASTDWCISQQRYWGIPLPIWVCSYCGRKAIIGSVEELRKKAVSDPGDLTDLHRSTVDLIKLKCDCGSEMTRIPDIFNVWFDSGIAPWASLGYPFNNQSLFNQVFPVDLICEAQDQIRGWFYVLMFCSMATFDKPAYKSVGMMGWVVDEKGEKMSKSIGNVISAKEGIQKLGADVIRLYYCYETAPWDVQKFSFSSAEEVRRCLNILWNIYQFYKTYSQGYFSKGISSNKKEAEYGNAVVLKKLEDKWIVSRLNSVINVVDESISRFELHKAGRELINFIEEDFSRWYIRLVRDRVSPSAEEEDRTECLSTIRYCLLTVSKLLSPITPFISESIFQGLRESSAEELSVSYCAYPSADESLIDKELEELFEKSKKITEAINSARQEAKIKIRWPVKNIIISGDNNARRATEILNQLLCKINNAKEITYSDSPPSKFVERSFEGGKIFLNPQRSEELLQESLLRELIRGIQAARKNNNFNVHESIKVCIKADEKTRQYLESNKEILSAEVGANTIDFDEWRGEYPVTAEAEGIKIEAIFSKENLKY